MGKFRRQDQQHAQQELWVPAAAVVTGPQDGFYAKLNAVPAKMRFTGNIHLLCEPYYKTGAQSGGRPPINPAVLFKMMIVGFLEGLGSDRGTLRRQPHHSPLPQLQPHRRDAGSFQLYGLPPAAAAEGFCRRPS